MVRRRAPFEQTRRGISVNLDPEERLLVRRLLGEIRELLGTTSDDDPKMRRLFPPAYLDDAEANTEFVRLMRDELIASRCQAIEMVDTFLGDDKRGMVTIDELHAFVMSLNSVRLVLGTMLDVGEDDDLYDLSPDDPGAAEVGLYHFLSWLLENAVSALS